MSKAENWIKVNLVECSAGKKKQQPIDSGASAKDRRGSWECENGKTRQGGVFQYGKYLI